MKILTAEARPDLWEAAQSTFSDVWPEYNMHGDVSGRYFGALVPRYARFQFLVWDEDENRTVARGRSVPLAWDGTLDDLPAGIDAAGLRMLEESRSPTTLCALAVEVSAEVQQRGLSSFVIGAMADLARDAGFDTLIAPVRPSWKERYPLTPIDEYASWVRDDGLPFDPWMRVHARLGADVLATETRSLRITGTVDEWERWTGMEFPADGSYVFPRCLAPLAVRDGTGYYWEPNVWMLHRVGPS
jgi:hypothetical protein